MADRATGVRIPKLSYRKPLSSEEVGNLRDQTVALPVPETTSIQTPASPALVRTTSVRAGPTTNVAPVQPQKKKGSLFGGLFAKEPTLMALAQFEADLTAKHGAATAQRVPHVSSRKMPEYVPKVNSKWDGVPEVVKQREREEKLRRRTSQTTPRYTTTPPAPPKNESTIEQPSLTSQERLPYPYTRPDSIYSSSSESSQRQRPRSIRTQDLRTASGKSLPEITAFFPHKDEISSLPSQSKTTSIPSSWSRAGSSKHGGQSDPESLPDHSSSPVVTPRDMSPVTPGYLSDAAVSSQLAELEGSRVVPPMDLEGSVSQRQPAKQRHVPIDAFLAGEAQQLKLTKRASRDATEPGSLSSKDEIDQISSPPQKQSDQSARSEPASSRNKGGTASRKAHEPAPISGNASAKTVKSSGLLGRIKR